MLNPVLRKNDKQARIFIFTISFVVFAAVVFLSQYKLHINPGFNVHYFAVVNAILNFTVAILLVCGFAAVKNKQYLLHKRLMILAIVLSSLFLISYIGHHLLAPETRYGGSGPLRYIYFVILMTHIFLATVILPFILFTAYRALTGEFGKHKKLSRYTWPLWLYVSVSGVIVYLLISPYYIPHI